MISSLKSIFGGFTYKELPPDYLTEKNTKLTAQGRKILYYKNEKEIGIIEYSSRDPKGTFNDGTHSDVYCCRHLAFFFFFSAGLKLSERPHTEAELTKSTFITHNLYDRLYIGDRFDKSVYVDNTNFGEALYNLCCDYDGEISSTKYILWKTRNPNYENHAMTFVIFTKKSTYGLKFYDPNSHQFIKIFIKSSELLKFLTMNHFLGQPLLNYYFGNNDNRQGVFHLYNNPYEVSQDIFTMDVNEAITYILHQNIEISVRNKLLFNLCGSQIDKITQIIQLLIIKCRDNDQLVQMLTYLCEHLPNKFFNDIVSAIIKCQNNNQLQLLANLCRSLPDKCNDIVSAIIKCQNNNQLQLLANLCRSLPDKCNDIVSVIIKCQDSHQLQLLVDLCISLPDQFNDIVFVIIKDYQGSHQLQLLVGLSISLPGKFQNIIIAINNYSHNNVDFDNVGLLFSMINEITREDLLVLAPYIIKIKQMQMPYECESKLLTRLFENVDKSDAPDELLGYIEIRITKLKLTNTKINFLVTIKNIITIFMEHQNIDNAQATIINLPDILTHEWNTILGVIVILSNPIEEHIELILILKKIEEMIHDISN